MPLWFYILTPLGWFSLYLTLVLLVHESGHLVVGLLTGHKITKFKVGLCKPIVRFQIGSIPFELSLDSMGGSVSCDNTKHVSQIGIFLTAMAGPFAVLLLATGVFLLIPEFSKQNYENETWQYFCQMILTALSCVTYWIGLEGIVKDFKNILVSKS
ncbi:MAG: site-2 protease family protein [bacterium]|nr:site-2 protease family protein [bacterium]